MSDPVAKLLVTLGMDSAEFTRGAKRAVSDVSAMRKGMTSAASAVKGAIAGMISAFAIGTVVEMAKAGLDYASSLGEQATQLGVTTRALQEYRYAASQAGIESGQMDQALAQLTKRIGAAATGSKKEAAAFKALGVDIRDANGHIIDAGDAIPLIAEGLKKIDSPAVRAKYLVDLFGKSGQALAPLMEGGAAGVNSLRDAAQKLGIVLSDSQINKADEAADKLSALKQVMEAKIAGAAADNVDSILELVEALGKLVDYAGKAAKAWRYFSDLDWSWNAPSIGDQFERMQTRELGPGVELTFDPKAEAAKRRKRTPSGTGVNWGSVPLAPKRTGSMPGRVNWPTGNAMGASAFGGQDWSRFTPGLGSLAKAANDVDGSMGKMIATAERGARQTMPELTAATGKLSDKLAQLRDATQNILDRLFPEKADQRQFAAEVSVLDTALAKGQMSADAHAQAIAALRREYMGLHRDLLATAPGESMQGVELVDGQQSIEDMSAAIDDRALDAFERMGEKADTTNVRIVGSMAQMVDGTLGQLDRLTRGIKSGNFFDVLGGVLGLIDGIAALATNGKGFKLGSVTFGNGTASGTLPGYASGGSMRLGGMAGVDTNLLSLNGRPIAKVTAGETMHITPANDRGGRESVVRVFVHPSGEFDTRVEQGAARVVAQAAPSIASMGANQAIANSRRMQMRSLGR